MIQREFPLSPLLGVGAICFNEEGRVLLVRRANEPLKGRWSIPGGLVEVGETLQDAVKREVLEETGIIIQPQAIVEVVERIYRSSNCEDERVRFHYVIVDYWCRFAGGALSAASDAADVCWIPRAEWSEAGIHQLERKAVEVIEKGWQMAQAAKTR